MGMVSATIAEMGVKRIKKGKTANLCVADITYLIVNLMDARKNLDREDFLKVQELFDEFQTCKKKRSMDFYRYVDTVSKIIEQYDKIAPYEKYSGNNADELRYIMQLLRNDETKRNIEEELSDFAEKNYPNDFQEIMEIIQSACGVISDEVAKAYIGVLSLYLFFGKTVCLSYFDQLMLFEIEKDQVFTIIGAPFFCSALCSEGIITEEEKSERLERYSSALKEMTEKKEEKKPTGTMTYLTVLNQLLSKAQPDGTYIDPESGTKYNLKDQYDLADATDVEVWRLEKQGYKIVP